MQHNAITSSAKHIDARALGLHAEKVQDAGYAIDVIVQLIDEDIGRRASMGPEPFMTDYHRGALLKVLREKARVLSEIGDEWEEMAEAMKEDKQ
ncbi:hypothetical protein [Halomonas sp. LBP4]|uniref:hypothetical protein n=1 Tax=Halomonas sp. LBP4 TaxID=2044917 RepID=UPI000D766400|nr:hypothetical protein [Halomonas sp. LBP4]PXX97363.1 hypothetical protein CR157_11560 [Halomonas sp. LBP4]